MSEIHELLDPHSPTLIDALIHQDCIEEACGHTYLDECPTHAVMVCGTCQQDPEIGLVGFAVEWPCHGDRAAPEPGEQP